MASGRNTLPPSPFPATLPTPFRRCAVGLSCSLWLAALLAGCAEGGSEMETPILADASSDTSVVNPDAAKDSPLDSASPPDSGDASEETGDNDAATDAGCPAGKKLCGNACVAIDDPAWGCGPTSCDPCDLTHGAAKCAQNSCAVASCDNGFSDCNNDPSDGCETSTATDAKNCGECGDACVAAHATPNCVGGACGIATCETGYDDCDFDYATGCEASLLFDPSNCGACGNGCIPVGGSACLNGVCKLTACSGAMGDCDGDVSNGCETDLTKTLSHCGFCYNACSLPNATPDCLDATCRVKTCNTGYGNCDGAHPNGCEIHLTESTSHCGACDAPCSTANNSSRTCEDGKCGYVCLDNFADCNGPQPGSSDDGCETPIDSSVANCGGCGLACTNAHGSTSCVGKLCVPQCTNGFGDCNANLFDGCETSVSDNVSHCGACNLACTNAHGTTSCQAGLCKPLCAQGWSDCDNNPSNGCETSLLDTTDHCGACGVKCTNANGTTSCQGGVCKPVCSDGFASCDLDPIDGCETQTATDPNNCGTCGHICVNPNGSVACSESKCVAGCSNGWGDCNGNIADGCETNTTNTTAHCGSCNNGCVNPHGATSCVLSACKPVCVSGWDSCNNDPTDGCETSLSDDVTNCGSCGFKCFNDHGSTACVSSACKPTCLSGWASCDNNVVNGCEKSITDDPANCGGCGVVCTALHGSNACVGGGCVPDCDTGFDTCDNNPANGCETNLQQDVLNCGVCGKSCAAPNAQVTCSAGACAIVACAADTWDLDKKPENGCEYSCKKTSDNEICDSKDNDCDGLIDEDFDKLNDPNNCGNSCQACGTSTGGLCCNGVCRNASVNDCGACGQPCTQGMLVINELMINPHEPELSDAQGEWFELYNTTSKPIDLRGFTLKDAGSDTHPITSVVPVIAPALGYVVLGINASKSTNGNVDVAYQYSNFSLGNPGDEVILLGHGSTEIDQVVWPSSTFATDGASKELSVNHRTYLLNNTLTNWCSATQLYYTANKGTPGAVNTCSK